MTRTSLVLLLVLFIATTTPCWADGRVRALEVGRANADWQQVNGESVLRLRDSDSPLEIDSRKIAGAVIDNYRVFDKLEFELESGGEVYLFVGGTLATNRLFDALLKVPITTTRLGFRHVTVDNNKNLVKAGASYVSADRRGQLLIAGKGRIRSIRINGGLATVSTETLKQVPPHLTVFDQTVTLKTVTAPN